MKNTNVLEGYRCPDCQSEGPFNIWGEALFLDVTDDGVTEFQDFQWNDDATFKCTTCGWQGTAFSFKE